MSIVVSNMRILQYTLYIYIMYLISNVLCAKCPVSQFQLEQLERLRSEDTPAASWLPTLLSHVGSQLKTRSNNLEDIGQGQRSSHATHLLMLVIICTTYGENPSGTVDATERTRFSKSRPNDLEDIGQGQGSCDTPSHAIDHLYQIWKESILICRCYWADTKG